MKSTVSKKERIIQAENKSIILKKEKKNWKQISDTKS